MGKEDGCGRRRRRSHHERLERSRETSCECWLLDTTDLVRVADLAARLDDERHDDPSWFARGVRARLKLDLPAENGSQELGLEIRKTREEEAA